jgi:uncharacterized membrane protein YccC
MSEAVSEAAARLERAVGRLAEALAQPRPEQGIPPAQVAELAARLDNTLARLRGALAELDGAEAEAHDSIPEADSPPDQVAGSENEPAAIAPAPPMQDEER